MKARSVSLSLQVISYGFDVGLCSLALPFVSAFLSSFLQTASSTVSPSTPPSVFNPIGCPAPANKIYNIRLAYLGVAGTTPPQTGNATLWGESWACYSWFPEYNVGTNYAYFGEVGPYAIKTLFQVDLSGYDVGGELTLSTCGGGMSTNVDTVLFVGG